MTKRKEVFEGVTGFDDFLQLGSFTRLKDNTHLELFKGFLLACCWEEHSYRDVGQSLGIEASDIFGESAPLEWMVNGDTIQDT